MAEVTALGAKHMEANETPPSAPKPGREQILAIIVKLLRLKGAPAVAQLEQKVKLGQGMSIKGVVVDTSLLVEALAQASKDPSHDNILSGQGNKAVLGHPATPSHAAPAPAAAPAVTAGVRWAVAAPSAAALAQKALQECETAEPFVRRVKNVGENKVAILTKPNVSSHATGEHLAPGEVFDVIARCSRVQDGRTFLRLRRSEGWVSTRSRKDLFKIVLASADVNASVEPVGSPTTFQSRSAQVLSRVDADGNRVDSDGRPLQASDAAAVSQMRPREFRVVGGRGQSILSHPSVSCGTSASVGGTLEAHEEFVADAVCIVQAEGRAYLRLQDGRGWICERSKADFLRYAVEPAGFRVQQDHYERPTAPKRALGGGYAKTVVIERAGSDYDAEASRAGAVAAAKPAPRSTPLKDQVVVLRSDSELWPKLLGAPRPINASMRVALRRISKSYSRKVTECEEDLKEVEKHVEGYARACDGKKLMQTHADALRKEIAKLELEWKVAVDKDLADLMLVPPSKPSKEKGQGTVAPVQVCGEAWHCAVVRAEQDDGEGGRAIVQHVGPLRPDAADAAEDLKRLAEAVSKRIANGEDKDDSPALKKKPRLSPTKDETAAAAN